MNKLCLLRLLSAMKVLGWICLMMLSATATASCISYDNAAITGRLQKLVFPGPPNYESVAGGDEEESGFYLLPQEPICVARNDTEPFIDNIPMVQLVLEIKGSSTYDTLRPYLGELVSCSGSLYAAHTGHHHAPILMWAAVCKAISPTITSNKPNDAYH